jgi:integrase
MPVFKRPGAETYSYDFRLKGVRHSGNTSCSTKREAEKYEDAVRKQAQASIADERQPMTMAVAVLKYWEEVGQHHANSDTTLKTLAWIEKELGKSKRVSQIKSADIARLIAKRRLPDAKGNSLSHATVNRSVTQPMRAILARAADTWGQQVQKIEWSKYMLKEPQERVRELHADEEARLFSKLRLDYHPIVKFSLLTGCRMQECLDLTWRQIDWRNLQIRVTGKGDKTRTIPLAKKVKSLLWVLPRADERVFTYASKRADHAPRGKLLPIEREGLKSIFERAIKAAEIEDFSFHDLRHTCATRLLRKTGNLRLVKELLGHEDIATTLKYAHVTKDDLRDAMDSVGDEEINTGNATGEIEALDK